MDWPVREALLAYEELLRADAKEDYRLALLAAVVGGIKKFPEEPAILKEW